MPNVKKEVLAMEADRRQHIRRASDQAGLPNRQEALKLAYERVCESYEGITDFRGKLLTLLPLATGAGAFLLLGREGSEFLGPVGLFGVLVTSGLYMYELRGIQRCHRLEVQACILEEGLGLSLEEGQFRSQPDRLAQDMVGPPAAGLVVYLAVVFAWIYLSGVGFELWNGKRAWLALFLIPYYAGVLLVAWKVLERHLPDWKQASRRQSKS
jgi:hypothetical protein